MVRLELAVTDQECIHHWRVSKEFTIAVAESMPAEKYSFRLTPDQMTFAELMMHIAVSQAAAIARVAKVECPVAAPIRVDREHVVTMLSQSFDFCIEQLADFQTGPMRRTYSVDWHGCQEATGAQIVMAAFHHTAHHRGQAEMYLRAVGIQPPAYRF